MPRVNRVKKARKPQGECGKCRKKIKRGEPYIWWKFRYGGRRVQCGTCPGPKRSELTQSDKLSRLYAMEESIEDALVLFEKDHDLDNLKSTLEDAANEVREVAEEYRESASNVESGMNNRMPICDELEEKADTLDGKADELENVSLEEFDEESVEKEGKETKEEAIERARESWADDIRSEVENYTDLSPE